MTTWMTTLAATADTAGSLSGHFTWIDWGVLIGYMIVTTLLGTLLAGKQKNMDDFFLGGKGLPWFAVSGSIIATEISAVTFVGVPAIVFANGGNFTYMQLGLIAGLISRFFVAFILVPAYYQKRIFSPYDYMGNKLGEGARRITTALFSLGGLLAQSSRVYLTAVILELVLAGPLESLEAATGINTLVWAVLLIGLVSVAWTVIGGISTVVWTDFMLFLVFITGAVTALGVIIAHLPGGWSQMVQVADEAGKFQLWDLDMQFSPTKEFTIWTAAIASVFGNIGAYGTDQLMAQRIFCCRGPRGAKLAVLSSWFGQAITAMMLLVGAGIYAYYKTFPEALTGQALNKYFEEPDRIFPIFILTQIPQGLAGLIIAGIFAAAISSMTSILAALSQTTLSTVYLPLRAKVAGVDPNDEDAMSDLTASEGTRIVKMSRILILVWGTLLCLAAFAVDAFKNATDVPILSLALGLAGYVHGALLATFLLAWLPLKVSGRGLVWAAPLSVMTVFALRFHEPWAYWACGTVMFILLVTWILSAVHTTDTQLRTKRLAKTVWLVIGIALVMSTTRYVYFHEHDPETGEVTMVYPTVKDTETGKPIHDLNADPIYLTHPMTDQPLLDESGNPIENINARPVVRDMNAGTPKKLAIAWPWYSVIGGAVAFIFGFLLAEPKRD